VKKNKLKVKLAEAKDLIAKLQRGYAAESDIRVGLLQREIDDMKRTWRPVPISHQWEPRDGRCALCDDHRDHERHTKPLDRPHRSGPLVLWPNAMLAHGAKRYRVAAWLGMTRDDDAPGSWGGRIEPYAGGVPSNITDASLAVPVDGELREAPVHLSDVELSIDGKDPIRFTLTGYGPPPWIQQTSEVPPSPDPNLRTPAEEYAMERLEREG
jgi:hypothetical protein